VALVPSKLKKIHSMTPSTGASKDTNVPLIAKDDYYRRGKQLPRQIQEDCSRPLPPTELPLISSN